MAELASFDEDVDFLKEHFQVDVLENEEGARIACVAAFQGRTMTSNCSGDSQRSNGYIGREAVKKGMVDPQLNMFGGEDRIWISPEGGPILGLLRSGSGDVFCELANAALY